jgi:hypothetical protein
MCNKQHVSQSLNLRSKCLSNLESKHFVTDKLPSGVYRYIFRETSYNTKIIGAVALGLVENNID